MQKEFEEFVPYAESLELKHLKFDEECFGVYVAGQLLITNDSVYNSKDIPVIKAPTFSQAFRWFRDKYGLYHIIHCPSKDVAIFTITGFGIPSVYSNVELKSYEDAELACLLKLIAIVKNK